MISSRKDCPQCETSVDRAHYARHVKSHNIQFKCKHYPSASFKRRDNYIRHMKVHAIAGEDDELACSDPIIEAEPFIIKEDQLKENLANFTIDIPNFTKRSDTSNFIHPFSCKIIGPRGSGKTSFTISYIQKIARLIFFEIFTVIASHDLALYDLFKDNNQILFI